MYGIRDGSGGKQRNNYITDLTNRVHFAVYPAHDKRLHNFT